MCGIRWLLIRSRSSCVQEEGERSKKEREIARKQGSKEGRNGNGRVSVNVVVDAKSIRKGNYYLGCGGRGAHLAKLIRRLAYVDDPSFTLDVHPLRAA